MKSPPGYFISAPIGVNRKNIDSVILDTQILIYLQKWASGRENPEKIFVSPELLDFIRFNKVRSLLASSEKNWDFTDDMLAGRKSVRSGPKSEGQAADWEIIDFIQNMHHDIYEKVKSKDVKEKVKVPQSSKNRKLISHDNEMDSGDFIPSIMIELLPIWLSVSILLSDYINWLDKDSYRTSSHESKRLIVHKQVEAYESYRKRLVKEKAGFSAELGLLASLAYFGGSVKIVGLKQKLTADAFFKQTEFNQKSPGMLAKNIAFDILYAQFIRRAA